MRIAEDFEKMTDQFKTDYQNRIATLRGSFRDTRHLLSQVRPPLLAFRRELGHETQKMMTDFRTGHKKMSTEMHQFLKETTRRIKSETNRMRSDAQRMMGTFHTQSNHRRAECKQLHGSAQAFFKAMAHAKQTHPLRGGTQHSDGTTPKPAGKRMSRRKKHHAPAAS